MKSLFWFLSLSLLTLGNFGLAFQDRPDTRQRPDPNEDPRRVDPKKPQPVKTGVNIQGKTVEAGFPTASKNPETAWKIVWHIDNRHGLVIEEAWFWREFEWLKVLGDSRVAEIHVPYYNNKTYYFDIGDKSTSTVAVTDDLARPGKNLDNKAVLEVRDSGVAWMKPEKASMRVRRGEELVLWAPLQAEWYLYLIEYRFRDDGSIAFRAGSTGSNSPELPHVTHMHNTIWRLDVDLGRPDEKGFVRNSVRWVGHKEPGPGQRSKQDGLVETLFNGGIEGGMEWRAEEFHRLRIVNVGQKNQQGNPISYELVPMRSGSARHYQPREGYSAKDVWVTPFAGQTETGEPNELNVRLLAKTASKGRRIENEDVVVWYTSSALHVPRDEDMLSRNRPGVTPTVWSGFELRPRDLFSASPFFDRKPKSK